MLVRDTDLMRPLPVFTHFGEEHLKLLAFSASRKTYETGETLFSEGDPADSGFLVMEGSVLMTEKVGEEEVERAIYGAGSLIGEIALLTPTERPATAIARATTNVMIITRELMRRVLEEHPEAARELRLYLHEKLSSFNDELKGARAYQGVPGTLN